MAPLRIALFAALVAGGAALRAVALPGRVAGRAARAAPCMTATPPEGSKEDGNGGDSSMDWDKAWKNEVVARETGTAKWRPEGREAATAEQIAKARLDKGYGAVTGSLSSWTGKWQFWLGVIALISIATALAGQSGNPGVDPSGFTV